MHPLKDYYFLSLSLPDLQLGRAPELSWGEVETLLVNNLRKGDYAEVESFLRLYDLQNIRSYWQGLPLGFIGNLDQIQIQTRIIEQDGLPSYLLRYLDRWPEEEERLQHFDQLLMAYYQKEPKERSPFFQRLLHFEFGLKLLLTYLRAKKMGKDPLEECQGMEDHPLYSAIFDREDQEHLELFEPYDTIPQLFEMSREDPKKLEEGLNQIRFNWIEEQIALDPFSITYILGYVMQFLIVDKESRAKETPQKELMNEIIEDIADE